MFKSINNRNIKKNLIPNNKDKKHPLLDFQSQIIGCQEAEMEIKGEVAIPFPLYYQIQKGKNHTSEIDPFFCLIAIGITFLSSLRRP